MHTKTAPSQAFTVETGHLTDRATGLNKAYSLQGSPELVSLAQPSVAKAPISCRALLPDRRSQVPTLVVLQPQPQPRVMALAAGWSSHRRPRR